MKRSRFSEETEAGMLIAELIRQHEIFRATFYQWRSKYAA